MSQEFKVEFDFGSGFEDISAITQIKEFYRERHLYNNLSPTIDTCKFRIRYNQTILSKLLLSEDDIIARVRSVEIGPVYNDYFYGYVQMNYKINSSTRVDWVEITIVDNNYLLDKTISSNLQFSDNKLMDYTDKANSIIHQILYSAGVSDSQIGDEIAYSSDSTKTVLEYFIHQEKQPDTNNTALSEVPYGGSYKEIIRNLLFQFGYTYYFNAAGKFSLFNFRDTDIDPGSNVFDSTNMIGRLEFTKKDPRYKASHIAWKTRETLENQVIFDESTNRSDVHPNCYIEVLAGDYYPKTATSSFTPEAYYDVVFSGGRSEKDIIAVGNPELIIEYADYIFNGTETISWTNPYANPVTHYTYTYKKALVSTTYKCKDYVSALAIAGISNITDTSYSETDMHGGCCLWHFWWGDCGGWGTNMRTRVWSDVVDQTIITTTYTAETVYEQRAYTGLAAYNAEDLNDHPGDTDWFEALPLSFKFKILNNGSLAKRDTDSGVGTGADIGSTLQPLYITKLQLKGNIILKGVSETYKDERFGVTERNYKYSADYIFTEPEAQALAESITNYFKNSTYKFKVVSNTLYEPGDWVLLTDNNFQNVDGFPVENKRCLIVSRKDEEFQSRHTYFLEEYADYTGA